jgi:hypothetical protein
MLRPPLHGRDRSEPILAEGKKETETMNALEIVQTSGRALWALGGSKLLQQEGYLGGRTRNPPSD